MVAFPNTSVAIRKVLITTSVLVFPSDMYFIGGFGTVAWIDVKGTKP